MKPRVNASQERRAPPRSTSKSSGSATARSSAPRYTPVTSATYSGLFMRPSILSALTPEAIRSGSSVDAAQVLG